MRNDAANDNSGKPDAWKLARPVWGWGQAVMSALHHHAVYRDRNGTTLMDDGESDPVAMTVAGLVPKKNKPPHYPTDAARQLFTEIMVEFGKAEKGEKSRWAGKMSAPAITLELSRRKGKGRKK